MSLLTKRLLAIAIIAIAIFPMVASATNGYFLIGYGAKSRGMGGVGVAEGVDGLATANNPATMADVGTRFDIGADFFSVPRGITHSDGTLSETTIVEQSDSEDTAFSHNDLFLIPNMGGTYQYSDTITLGFAFTGAGVATNYDQTLPAGNSSYFFNFNGLASASTPGGDPDNKVGVKLLQMQIPMSIAYKWNEQHTVGASFVFAAQFFEALGLQAFEQLNFGATTGNLTNMGTDHSFGAGIRLGWTGDYMEDTMRVGVNYSSRVYMTEFDRYKNLFAEQGDFDIPSNWAVGLSYQADKKTTIKADYQRINYSEVAAVGNPGPWAYNSTEFNPLCPGPDTIDCKLGGDNGLGFGWVDQNIVKLGLEYLYKPNLTLRLGFNHGSGVVPPDQVLFNMLAPAVVEDHATLGATYDFSPDIELSVSYVHGFEKTVTGPTLFQPLGSDPNVTVNNASLTLKQRALGAALGIKW